LDSCRPEPSEVARRFLDQGHAPSRKSVAQYLGIRKPLAEGNRARLQNTLISDMNYGSHQRQHRAGQARVSAPATEELPT